MDLRVLEYFLRTAEEENISRAAEILHVTQPTLSRQLAELENELGKKLFARTNRNTVLTEDGVKFRETARNILLLYEKAKEESTEGELEGDYRIGAAEIESFAFVAEKIRDFRKIHPKVRFHVFSENAERIRDLIDVGALDAGFIPRSVSTVKYDFLELPLSLEWGVLVKKDHPLAAESSITMKDLRNETLIIPENSIFRDEINVWQKGTGNAGIFYTLVHNAMILTSAGAGITVCLRTEHSLPESLKFIPLAPKQETSGMLIWKKDSILSPLQKAFLAMFES